jgi:phosphoribosyl 1,2-cyclic phosphodiesterase
VKDQVPMYCPPAIEPFLKKKYGVLAIASRQGFLRTIKKSEIGLNEFCVRHFEVPHDSDGGCFGYNVFFDGGGKTRKVSISTDIARPTKSVVNQMVDSDAIVLESNYDPQMLEESGRPTWLKRRITENGHLSNDQCGESIAQILDQSKTFPECIALAHVSRECNTNTLARECTEGFLASRGIQGIDVIETYPERPSSTITI